MHQWTDSQVYSFDYCTKTSNENGDEMENVAKDQVSTEVFQWKKEKCKTPQ